MLNKRNTIIVTVLIIIVGVVTSQVLSNQKQPLQRKGGAQTESVIKTLTVKTEDSVSEIEVSGRLTAYDKIELYAEVSGVLVNTPKRFEAGKTYRKGETLVKIDDAVYRNNLLAQKSSLLNQMTLMLPDLRIDFPETAIRWEKFLAEFDLQKKLPSIPEARSDQEKYYIASRNIYNLYYSAKSMEATLDKYQLQAPFTGEVTLSHIKPGTLIRMGQKIGEFMSSGLYELQVPVGLSHVQYIAPGNEVSLTSADIPGTFKGTVNRINKAIDQQTQTVMAYITTTDNRLRDGMYLTAHIQTKTLQNTARIPRYLMNGKSEVYVVTDSGIKTKTVQPVHNEGGDVIVLGLNDGDILLDQEYEESMNEMKVNLADLN